MDPSQPTTPPERPPHGGVLVEHVVGSLAVLALVLVALHYLVRADAGPRPEATRVLGELADPGVVYDPVRAGEPLPRGFRQLLRRDAILPIYDPAHVAASAVAWDADTLVIGVELERAARAYPVSFLNRREMVVDSIAGIPVLVTW